MTGSFTLDDWRLAAETYVHDYGLDVIQPRWLTGDRDFGLIARDGDVLVAVHAVIARPDDSTDDVTQLSEDRIHRIRGAARTWMIEHALRFPLIRVDVLALVPMLSDRVGVAYAEGVA